MAEDNLSYLLSFPFESTGYITLDKPKTTTPTLSPAALQARMAFLQSRGAPPPPRWVLRPTAPAFQCLGYDKEKELVQFITDQSQCLLFTMQYAPGQGFNKDDPEVVTLSRFDSNAVAFFNNEDDEQKNIDDRLKAFKQQLGYKDTKSQSLAQFFQNYDPFFADLGATGRRRVRRQGRGMQILPAGQLVAPPFGGFFVSLLPSERLLQFKYIVMSVYFSIQQPPDSDAVLLSFARSSGCVIFVTGLMEGSNETSALVGLKCYKNGRAMFTQQLKRWPKNFSLLSGTHKISLLFSTDPAVSFRLFVDGLAVMSVPNPGEWDLEQASQKVRLFTDQNFWQYDSLSATLKRFSLVVSDNVQKIEEVASRVGLDGAKIQPLKQNGDLETESDLETRWENCRVISRQRGTNLVGDVQCNIIPLRNNVPVSVPSSLLRVACSRPRCEIRLSYPGNRIPKMNANFTVIYSPNYPASFNSENVGAPPMFADLNLVTDGWNQLNMAFDVQFAPDQVKMEMDASSSTTATNLIQTESKVQIADMRRYVCVETKLNPRTIRPISFDIDDDMF
eukprot:TRINITY_DN5057_c0_g2_i4.p1 TRINITY_DN5057_c0_g2~~TRINITY_DN5057_c0_g2_i4.p1  ORF type:complete len:581 (-),score=153.34 TRINITY_DN5057_c0_g2_i4:76-1758(-)